MPRLAHGRGTVGRDVRRQTAQPTPSSVSDRGRRRCRSRGVLVPRPDPPRPHAIERRREPAAPLRARPAAPDERAVLPEAATWHVATRLQAAVADAAEVVRLFGLPNWVEQAAQRTKGALGGSQYQVSSDPSIHRHGCGRESSGRMIPSRYRPVGGNAAAETRRGRASSWTLACAPPCRESWVPGWSLDLPAEAQPVREGILAAGWRAPPCRGEAAAARDEQAGSVENPAGAREKGPGTRGNEAAANAVARVRVALRNDRWDERWPAARPRRFLTTPTATRGSRSRPRRGRGRGARARGTSGTGSAVKPPSCQNPRARAPPATITASLPARCLPPSGAPGRGG